MIESELKQGTVVKHFKRELLTEEELKRNQMMYLYRIIGVAHHTEVHEMLVIYQALYDERNLYARPINMFLSKVDKGKYPGVQQEYRFEIFKEGDYEV